MSAPLKVKRAIQLMVATIILLLIVSLWRFLRGDSNGLQLVVNTVIYSLFFFFPWRVFRRSWNSAVVWAFLICTSIAPVVMGYWPDALLDTLILLGVVVPVQVSSVLYLLSRDSVVWLTQSEAAV